MMHISVNKLILKISNLGHFVIVDQENQVVDFILDHIVLFLPFEILLLKARVKQKLHTLQGKMCTWIVPTWEQ